MVKVWDKETREPLTCWYGRCAQDGSDEFWIEIPGQEDEDGSGVACWIFCSRKHQLAFVKQRVEEHPILKPYLQEARPGFREVTEYEGD